VYGGDPPTLRLLREDLRLLLAEEPEALAGKPTATVEVNSWVIDKGIPIPPKLKRGGDAVKNGLRDAMLKMEVGDSILLNTVTQAQNASGLARDFGRFTYREWNGKYRLWRVE
jgi:hypothetical protein